MSTCHRRALTQSGGMTTLSKSTTKPARTNVIWLPKAVLPGLHAAAEERGVKPSTVVCQALKFYLAATDPSLVANTVAEAIKPLAADIRHIKYEIDKAVGGNDEKPKSEKHADQIEQLVAEQLAKEAARQQRAAANREEQERKEREARERKLNETLRQIDANTPHKSTSTAKGGNRV